MSQRQQSVSFIWRVLSDLDAEDYELRLLAESGPKHLTEVGQTHSFNVSTNLGAIQ